MTQLRSNGVWSGGRGAWWKGLREAVQNAEERVSRSTTEETRQVAQSELELLKRQERDAKQSSHRWLF